MSSKSEMRIHAEQAIQAFVDALLNVTMPSPISRVLVFGSYARGDFCSDSDIDVAVVLEGSPVRYGSDVNKDIVLGTHEAARAYDFLVSPVVLWESELSDVVKSRVTGFHDNVLRESVQWDTSNGGRLP